MRQRARGRRSVERHGQAESWHVHAPPDLGGRRNLGSFEASLSFMESSKTTWAKSETLPKPQIKRRVGEKKNREAGVTGDPPVCLGQ